MIVLVHLLFFLSGAASLVYEVAWARSLKLVFGGSNLAVTTVLMVFMGGLALGSRVLGKRADASARPLRLYGLLELGVAVFAIAFLGLMKLYPHVYVPLARVAEENRTYLSIVRVLFASLAMLGPTTLMGGTLPVLTRFVATQPERLGRRISLLYGLNTLGGVTGTLACGFVLLRTLGVGATQWVAIAVNAFVGVTAIILSRRLEHAGSAPVDRVSAGAGEDTAPVGPLAARFVLWGTGISGFCALGYEVLWTRMLGLVVGTSVYSFTIILVAFLGGIAAGSYLVGLAHRFFPARGPWRVVGCGAVQMAIGISALAVTVLMRDLPAHATQLQKALLGASGSEFAARQWASFAVALAYLFVPACFMGAAFPLAGTVVANERRATGGGLGVALMYNTAGSILGAALTGFVLIHQFGIERSLQLLSLANFGFGLLVAASVQGRAWVRWAVAAGTAALLLGRAIEPDRARFWDSKFFAVYTNNLRDAFETRQKRERTLGLFSVLYFFEGTNETISVVLTKQPVQSFVVNGRTEASTYPEDVQVQRPLGHVPMLLHHDPRKVFVLGTGAGMTLGAASLHPSVERIVLAEIEPGVLPATRIFGEWNHHVLEDPRLRIVFNDGRNYLLTTAEKFDVITADPIHPWSGGAAYLYTKEYFRSVAEHLLPGGVACQWLPLYELSARDVKSVVRTFSENFEHVAIWLTYWDAILVGSNAPILFDEAHLARRMAVPAVSDDLAIIDMSNPEDFLSYFLAGTAGARAFAADGPVNTDDNLFLEFSAPESMGRKELTGAAVLALSSHREPIFPYLRPASGEAERLAQASRWHRNDSAARIYDPAHVLSLWRQTQDPQFAEAVAALARDHPDYAPSRFLRYVTEREVAPAFAMLDQASFPVIGESGGPTTLTISAVLHGMSYGWPTVVFLDHSRKAVFGKRTFEARPDRIPGVARAVAQRVLESLRSRYQEMTAQARQRGQALPSEEALLRGIRSEMTEVAAVRLP